MNSFSTAASVSATALHNPPIGLGCTGMTPHSYPDSPRRDEMIDTLRTAVEIGIRFFDTSEIQGPFTGEELIGDAFGKGSGFEQAASDAGVMVATKFGWNIDGATPTGTLNSRPENIRQVAYASAKRLKVERLDLFMQHRVDPEVPIEDVAGTVAELIDEGVVARFGLSEAAASTIRSAHRECPVAAVESEYSLWTRGVEDSVLPTCAQIGAGFIAYSPLGKGMLTGCVDSPNNDSNSPRLHSENFAHNQAIARQIARIGADYNATAAQVALAWLVGRQPGILAIPGSTNPKRIAENLAAASIELSDEHRHFLDHLLDEHPVQGERYVAKHLEFMDTE